MLGKKLTWVLCLFLCACSAGGPASGTGGDLGGGPVGVGAVGGPLGGGNAATGTVSLPAPSSTSVEGVVTGAYVICKNVEGPTVECQGGMPSARVGSSVRLAVFPASYALRGKPLIDFLFPQAWAAGFSTSVVNGPQGWSASVVAAAGEKIEILLLDPRIDQTYRVVLPVPLVNQSIDWNLNNGMKNLTVDSEGNRFFSLRWWSSLLIGEAHADTPISPILSGALLGSSGIYFHITEVLARPACEGEIEPPILDRYKDNYFRIYWLAKGSSERKEIVLKGGLQSDIRDIAPFKDPETGKPYLAVAIYRVVYVIAMEPTPRVQRKIYFPREIESLLDMGDRLFVLQRPRERDPAAEIATIDFGGKQFYQIQKSAAAGFPAACIASLESETLQRFISSDAAQGAFAWTGLYADGLYRVWAGKGEGAGSESFKIFESNDPVSVHVLGLQDQRLSLAILNPLQKRLRLMQFDLADAHRVLRDLEVDMSTLRSGVLAQGVSNPTTLSVDRTQSAMGIVDIGETQTSLLTLPFNFHAGLLQVDSRVQRQSLGAVAPRLLVCDETPGQEAWTYNQDPGDGNPPVVASVPRGRVALHPELLRNLMEEPIGETGDLPPVEDVTN